MPPPASIADSAFARTPTTVATVTEHSSLPMVAVEGEEALLRYANPAFCRLVGRSVEELVGRRFAEVLPEGKGSMAILGEVVRTRRPGNYTEERSDAHPPVQWAYTLWPIVESETLVGVMIQVTETAMEGKTVLEINEALLLGSLRQHALTEEAGRLNQKLNEKIEEHARTEKALRRSEESYRAFVMASADVVYQMSPDWREMHQLHGRGYLADTTTPTEGWMETYIPDDERERVVAAIAKAIQTKSLYELEHRVVGLSGATGWVVSRAVPLLDERGEVKGWFGTATDITDRRRTQEALRISERRYRTVFDAIDEGFAIVEMIFDAARRPLDYRFVETNAAFAKHTGLTGAAGRTARELMPELEAHWFEIFGEVALTGNAVRVVHEARPLGARVFDVYACCLGPDEPNCVAIVFADISERRRLEAALQASETYFRELTQNLPIGVWTTLPDGRVDFVNNHWLGYAGRELLDTEDHAGEWVELAHPTDRAKLLLLGAQAQLAGESYLVEARFQHADSGVHRWFLKRSLVVRGAQGQLLKRIGLCVDIDDLKRSQRILSDHAEELTARVEARTGELRETIGELEAFSYSISHDLRAPLRTLRGYSQLLLETHGPTLDAESLGYLHRIDAGGARMDALIQDVLTYARLLRSETVQEPLSLAAVVQTVIDTYPLHEGGAEIVIAGPLPMVLGNEASLIQVLANLLTNAVKFVAPGVTPRVRLRAEKEGDEACLWIEDNGIGIDPRDHARIWNIFTQVAPAQFGEGTGIGLAIVRKAVERMGGKIGVQSALGQGSRFWLRLRNA